MLTRKLMPQLVSATVALAIVLGGCGVVSSQVFYTNDFEDDPLGQYTRSNLNADWNSPSGSNGVDEGRVSIVNEGASKAMRVEYPAGLFGSGDDKTGGQWKFDFDQGYEAVELEYRLKFEDGFDFVRGGKLPGLAGGAANSGGNTPNGTDGFSARMHWRTNGSSGSPLNSNETDRANIAQYVYHPDQVTNGGVNGDDLDWDDGPSGEWREFDSDQWYHVRHRIELNTPGVNGGEGLHDGVVQAWLDGVQVLDVDNIRFRDVASLQIDVLYFSTFFGGGSQSWATSKDEVAYFDDFRLTAVSQVLGDFDNDGDVDADDVDLLSAHIGTAASANYAMDLNGDGNITLLDHDQHIETLVQSDLGVGALIGDVNLDGDVDVSQFNSSFENVGDASILLSNLGATSGASYADGDLNGDGDVDVSQFDSVTFANVGDASRLLASLGQSQGSASPASSAVPEPGCLLLWASVGIRLGIQRRRR